MSNDEYRHQPPSTPVQTAPYGSYTYTTNSQPPVIPPAVDPQRERALELALQYYAEQAVMEDYDEGDVLIVADKFDKYLNGTRPGVKK